MKEKYVSGFINRTKNEDLGVNLAIDRLGPAAVPSPMRVTCFTPDDERAQIALGERVLSIWSEPGAEIVAEDLGTVPDFVRESLGRIGIPGFRVFR